MNDKERHYAAELLALLPFAHAANTAATSQPSPIARRDELSAAADLADEQEGAHGEVAARDAVELRSMGVGATGPGTAPQPSVVDSSDVVIAMRHAEEARRRHAIAVAGPRGTYSTSSQTGATGPA